MSCNFRTKAGKFKFLPFLSLLKSGQKSDNLCSQNWAAMGVKTTFYRSADIGTF